jgi:hypothetical protein
MKKKMLSDYAAFFGFDEDEIQQFSRLLEDERGFQEAVTQCIDYLTHTLRPQTSDEVLLRQLLVTRAVRKAQVCAELGIAPMKVALAMAFSITEYTTKRVLEKNVVLSEIPKPTSEDIAKEVLPAGTLVEVQKLSASANPVEESASWDSWVPGLADNSGSLPVGYFLRGVLMDPLCVSQRVHVYRIERNGISIHGDFESTPIITIHDGFLVETFNSIYQITPVEIHVPEEEQE